MGTESSLVRVAYNDATTRYASIGVDRSVSDLGEIQNWQEDQRAAERDWEDSTFLWRERHNGVDGQHYWRFDSRNRGFNATPVPPWRSEWTAPFCFSIVDDVASRVANSTNAFFGVPVSDDSDDLQSASAVSRYARFLRYKEKFTRLRKKATRLQCIDGMHFYKVRWDPAAGEVHVDVVPAWEIRIDPWARNLDEAQRVTHEQWLHIDVVRRMWGARRRSALGDIEPDESRIPWEVKRRFEAIRGGFSPIQPEKLINGIVQYLEVHERPTYEYPMGRLRVFCNDVVLFDSKKKGHPYAMAGSATDPLCIPFVQGSYEAPEGRFRGNGIVSLIWDTVKLVETQVNQAVEHNAMTVYPTWFMDESMRGSAKPSTEPGQIRYYDTRAVNKPECYTPEPLSSQFMALPSFLINMIYEHVGSGQGQASAPYKRADTATAVAIASESDKGRVQSLHVDLDNQDCDAMWMAIQLERYFGSGKRHAQIIGRGRVNEVMAYENADLAGAQSLFVVSAVSLSDNKQLRMQNVRELVKEGFINIEDAHDYIDLPPPEDERADLTEMNKRVAWANINRLKNGDVPYIEPTWDHRSHLRVMARYIGIDADWTGLSESTKQTMREYAGALQAEMASIAAGESILQELSGGPNMGPPGGNAPAETDTNSGQTKPMGLTDPMNGGSNMGHGDPTDPSSAGTGAGGAGFSPRPSQFIGSDSPGAPGG